MKCKSNEDFFKNVLKEYENNVKETKSTDTGFEKASKSENLKAVLKEVREAHQEVVELMRCKFNKQLEQMNEKRIIGREELLYEINYEIETNKKFQVLSEHRKKYQEELDSIKCKYIEAEITAEVNSNSMIVDRDKDVKERSK